nr:MAG TPA: helix-turn-helix domain protein [Caudoviricetes sp.]
MNQREKIVFYIQKFGSISSMEAFQDLGITRLSARIYELREEGYKFEETFKASKNRFGEIVYYKRYRFQKETKVDKMF